MSKKAPKFEALVVNAIRRLQAAQGSTAGEIAGYLAQEYDVTGPEVRRQIQLTIRRGVNYGILQKLKRGGYITCDRNVPEPLDRTSIAECYSRRSSRRHRRPKRSGRSRHRLVKSRGHRHRGRSARKRAGGRKRAASRRGRKMTTGSRRIVARASRKRRAAASNDEKKATSQSGQETPTSEGPVSNPPSRGRSTPKSPTRNP